MQDGNTDTSAVQMTEKPASESVEKTEKKASKKNSNKVWLVVLLILSITAAVLAVVVIIVAIVSGNSGNSSGGASGGSADDGGSSLDGEGGEGDIGGEESDSGINGDSSDGDSSDESGIGVDTGIQGGVGEDKYSPSNWGAVSEITEEERQLAEKCLAEADYFKRSVCILQVYNDANDLDKLLNVYAIVIGKMIEREETVLAVNLITLRSSFLAQNGKCDTALAFYDTIDYENFTEALQGVMYNGAFNVANNCGYTEASEKWAELRDGLTGDMGWGD